MTDILIDLGPGIERRDLINLRQRLVGLNEDDQIMIRMEAADAHEADLITAELTEQGFDWQPHGSHSGLDYYVIAKKRRVH